MMKGGIKTRGGQQTCLCHRGSCIHYVRNPNSSTPPSGYHPARSDDQEAVPPP